MNSLRKDSQRQRGARGNSFESVLHKEITKLVSSIRFLSVFRDWISLQFSGVHRQRGTRSSNASSSRSYLTCTKVYRQLGKKQPDSSPFPFATSLPIYPSSHAHSLYPLVLPTWTKKRNVFVVKPRTWDAP